MDNNVIPSSFILLFSLFPLCLNVIKVSEFFKMSFIDDFIGVGQARFHFQCMVKTYTQQKILLTTKTVSLNRAAY